MPTRRQILSTLGTAATTGMIAGCTTSTANSDPTNDAGSTSTTTTDTHDTCADYQRVTDPIDEYHDHEIYLANTTSTQRRVCITTIRDSTQLSQKGYRIRPDAETRIHSVKHAGTFRVTMHIGEYSTTKTIQKSEEEVSDKSAQIVRVEIHDGPSVQVTYSGDT